MQLSRAHVLVTGASRGIGECLAREAAGRGALVTLVARSPGPLAELARETGGFALTADLADRTQLDGLVARAEQQAARPVDVLVNNAGLDGAASLLDVPADDVADVVAVNLHAPIELTRQVLPGMVQRGRGHVVNVSSGFSTVNAPGLATYCATKAGLSHFTGSLALELRGTGVDTTLVEPGPVRTDLYAELHRSLPIDALRRLMRLQLTAEVDPDDVARATLDKVESDGGHVVRPRRMAPAMALTWLPRTATGLVLTGVRRR
ncbi:MAG TPA: SDR family NAD(P)-dependent oxidoreductase [Mycobacteriales bacterium]|nr:SDR family NAD(P)-dependent oxidoreductase [Mycobacteriales bacterium]